MQEQFLVISGRSWGQKKTATIGETLNILHPSGSQAEF